MTNTVWEAFARSAAQYAGLPFLHIPRQATAAYRGSAINLSYNETREQVEELAARYRVAGYDTGHRVALVLENRVEFFLHFLALNSVGAGIVPVNAGFRPEEMRYVIRHSDTCLVITLPEHRARVLESLGEDPPPVLNSDFAGPLPKATQHGQGAPGLLSGYEGMKDREAKISPQGKPNAFLRNS